MFLLEAGIEQIFVILYFSEILFIANNISIIFCMDRWESIILQ